MHRLSYANVTASVALFLALGGTSVAATNLVNGKTIKPNSIPADRVKAHSLGGTQIDAGTLGVVPHAARADSAGHADAATTASSAGHADTAGDAVTLGGKSAAQILASGDVKAGTGESMSSTAQTLLDYPDLGLRVETDGDPDFDTNVTFRNTGANPLSFPNALGAYNLYKGQTVTWGEGDTPWGASVGEARVLAQSSADPSDMVLIDCFFPGAGAGKIMTYCTETRSH